MSCLLRPDACSSSSAACSTWRHSKTAELEGPAKNRSYVFRERHRIEYLATRALIRPAVLSSYRPVEPAAWRFAPTAHGRPEIDPAAASRSTSPTTRPLIVCAISPRRGAHGRRRRTAHPRRRGRPVSPTLVFAAAEPDCARALPEPAATRSCALAMGPQGGLHQGRAAGPAPAARTRRVLVRRRRGPQNRVRGPRSPDVPERWTFRHLRKLPRSPHRARARVTRPDPVVRVHRVRPPRPAAFRDRPARPTGR